MEEESALAIIIKDFSDQYRKFHYYVMALICCMGIPCQVMMLIVLGGKGIFSPTNLLLMSLSGSQLFLLVNNLYMVTYRLFAEQLCLDTSYAMVLSMLLIVNMSVVFHTIAVFHVVALSVIRYISIGWFARRQAPWFTHKKARFTSCAIYATVVIICIPIYLNGEVEFKGSYCGNVSAYELLFRDPVLSTINYWLLALMFKLFPCCVLLVMSVLLVRELKHLNEMSRKFLKKGAEQKSVKTYSGTTHLILMVMCLFVAVELPHGMLALLAGVVPDFSRRYYFPLGDLCDMLTLLYSSVNFVIFGLMSSPFRAAFRHTFCAACAAPANNNTDDLNDRTKAKQSMIVAETDADGHSSPPTTRVLSPVGFVLAASRHLSASSFNFSKRGRRKRQRRRSTKEVTAAKKSLFMATSHTPPLSRSHTTTPPPAHPSANNNSYLLPSAVTNASSPRDTTTATTAVRPCTGTVDARVNANDRDAIVVDLPSSTNKDVVDRLIDSLTHSPPSRTMSYSSVGHNAVRVVHYRRHPWASSTSRNAPEHVERTAAVRNNRCTQANTVVTVDDDDCAVESSPSNERQRMLPLIYDSNTSTPHRDTSS